MKLQILKSWDRLQSSFWFIPTLMAIGAGVLAYVMMAVDDAVTDERLLDLGLGYAGGADGASAVLSTIAGSMITITGVVFSMTLVTLSLATSQFGPRLLRNFMRDTSNQIVLGAFVATFLYCLLVLRSVRRPEEGDFVPHLSVSMAVLFAVASLAVLIFFIHHVAVSIQTDEVTARVGDELLRAVDRLFPEEISESGSPPAEEQSEELPQGVSSRAATVVSEHDGYVQFIDGDALLDLAESEDLILRIERRPGKYVVARGRLVSGWPADRVTADVAGQVRAAFVLGRQRTHAQDVEFSMDQLVEIAVRALSPGINDPFTAIGCVDRIGSALCRLAQRKTPSPFRRDEKGNVRVIAPPSTFADVADAAFNQIRQHGQSDAAVTIRLLETIAVVAALAKRPADREALRMHAAMIARAARKSIDEEEDLRAVEDRFMAAYESLESGTPG